MYNASGQWGPFTISTTHTRIYSSLVWCKSRYLGPQFAYILRLEMETHPYTQRTQRTREMMIHDAITFILFSSHWPLPFSRTHSLPGCRLCRGKNHRNEYTTKREKKIKSRFLRLFPSRDCSDVELIRWRTILKMDKFFVASIFIYGKLYLYRNGTRCMAPDRPPISKEETNKDDWRSSYVEHRAFSVYCLSVLWMNGRLNDARIATKQEKNNRNPDEMFSSVCCSNGYSLVLGLSSGELKDRAIGWIYVQLCVLTAWRRWICGGACQDFHSLELFLESASCSDYRCQSINLFEKATTVRAPNWSSVHVASDRWRGPRDGCSVGCSSAIEWLICVWFAAKSTFDTKRWCRCRIN